MLSKPNNDRMTSSIQIHSILEIRDFIKASIDATSKEVFIVPAEQMPEVTEEFTKWCICESLETLAFLRIRNHDKNNMSFNKAWNEVSNIVLQVCRTTLRTEHLGSFNFYNSQVQVIITERDLIIAG